MGGGVENRGVVLVVSVVGDLGGEWREGEVVDVGRRAVLPASALGVRIIGEIHDYARAEVNSELGWKLWD
jgi:hypothetical protein